MFRTTRTHMAAFAALAAMIGLGSSPAAAAPSDAPAAPLSPSLTASTSTASQPGDVIWQEDFDQLGESFLPRVNDPGIAPGTIGFTHKPPRGWTVANDGFSGGVEEWRGWSFTTKGFWNDADLQRRNWFSGAHDVIAVVDGDEWSDAGSPTGRIDTGLTTDAIDVDGRDAVQVEFTSHYRSAGTQKARVLVAFDGGAPQEVLRYDASPDGDNAGGDVQSRRERIVVEVPEGAREAKVTWRYHDAGDDWFWAIDDAALTVPLTARPGAGDPDDVGTVIDVLSDVQGDEPDYTMVMEKLNAMPDVSGATVINGDVTADGSLAQTEVFTAVAAATPPASGRLLLNFGNHDEHSAVANFFDLAGRDTLWDEQVIDGVPLLFVTSDRMLNQLPSGAWEEQLAWLAERLAFWADSGKPVLLFAHHNLADSVSGTYAPNYSGQWDRPAELTDIVAEYGNTILFTSHTHWDLALDDWFSQRVFAGGDPRGLPIFNTGSIQTKWGPSGDIGETNFGQQEATGLRVSITDDRVRVDAHDFRTDTIVQSVEVPIVAPHTPPALETTTSPAEPTGTDGWHTAPVDVALTTEGESLRGELKLDDGEWVPFDAPVRLAEDGVHSIASRGSVDDWRQPERRREVKIDTNAPISNARTDREARTISLQALDATSGVARIEHRVGDGAFELYTVPIVAGPEAFTVEFLAIDGAGNSEALNTASLPAAGGPGTPGAGGDGSGGAGATSQERLSVTGVDVLAWAAAAVAAAVAGAGVLLRRHIRGRSRTTL